MGVAAAGLHHSSRQCQTPVPLSEAKGSNLHPHGYQSDLFPLHHSGNSSVVSPFKWDYYSPLYRVGRKNTGNSSIWGSGGGGCWGRGCRTVGREETGRR